MLTEKVKETIKKYDLIKEDQHIVIGLSGGPDSVCLFHVLLKIGRQMNLTLHPVHVNHKLREGYAERDQAYVENLCRQNGLKCRSFVVDCNELARKMKMTSEEAGRKARYDAFCRTAEEISLTVTEKDDQGLTLEEARKKVVIAVAQNANDQAETILFRLLRGTGTDGLSGIAYERQERGFKVVRPILDIYRSDIEAYCRENELDPVRDHTNEEAIYTRNKIRLELMPLLEERYNENMKGSLLRLGRIAAADKDYIWKQTDKLYSELAQRLDGCVVMDRKLLSDTHVAIRHRLMLRAFADIGLDQDISEERLCAADSIIHKKQAPKKVQFPHHYCVEVARGKVRFFNESENSVKYT